ncbi:hypothetical protein SAMN05192562_1121, partial [Kosakonia arachidis]
EMMPAIRNEQNEWQPVPPGISDGDMDFP